MFNLFPSVIMFITFANSPDTDRPDILECRAGSGSKLFYTLIILLKEFFEKVDFVKKKKTSADDKKGG